MDMWLVEAIIIFGGNFVANKQRLECLDSARLSTFSVVVPIATVQSDIVSMDVSRSNTTAKEL